MLIIIEHSLHHPLWYMHHIMLFWLELVQANLFPTYCRRHFRALVDSIHENFHHGALGSLRVLELEQEGRSIALSFGLCL